MQRRESLKLIPLVFSGIGSLPGNLKAECKMPCRMNRADSTGSLEYTHKVIKMLEWVRETQSDKILEGAYAIARAIDKGKKIWSCWDLGHTTGSDLFAGRNGMPEVLTVGYDFDKVKNGDLVLANFPWPAGYIADLAKRDLFVIGGPCPWGGDARGYENITPDIQKLKIRPIADIWIETNVDTIGAQVDIPGSDVPMAPESGPLNGTILWMMLADACRILAIEGKSVKIAGDEPALKSDAPRVNLSEPLMGLYFDEVIRQLKNIANELGDIRKMADMASDTLLNGGSVYFYSRYFESMAGEAVGRRGGFLFAKGLADGSIQGTSKDCVIMGTYAPDDPVDLKNLDEFKKRGMKIASIGPTTRDLKVPEGRAVFKETEIHAGKMIDTYGLFALPEFERKICPTSGSLVTSILWVMSVELALDIIDKTGGNVPAIYCNGALNWAGSHNSRMSALAAQRGY